MPDYPTSLDTLTNPTEFDHSNSGSVPLYEQLSDLNDIAEALEAKVGVDGSAVTTSHDYRISQLEGGVGSGTFKVSGGIAYVKHPVSGLWHKLIVIVAEDGSLTMGIDQTAS